MVRPVTETEGRAEKVCATIAVLVISRAAEEISCVINLECRMFAFNQSVKFSG